MAEQDSQQPDLDAAGAMSIFEHLRELRDRLVKSLVVVLLIFVAMIFVREQLFLFLTTELTEKLLAANPENGLISTQVAGAFLMPLKLAFLSPFCGYPYVLHQFGALSHQRLSKRKTFCLTFICLQRIIILFRFSVYALCDYAISFWFFCRH